MKALIVGSFSFLLNVFTILGFCAAAYVGGETASKYGFAVGIISAVLAAALIVLLIGVFYIQLGIYENGRRTVASLDELKRALEKR